MSMKNSNHIIGNRARDLPAIASPRAPSFIYLVTLPKLLKLCD